MQGCGVLAETALNFNDPGGGVKPLWGSCMHGSACFCADECRPGRRRSFKRRLLVPSALVFSDIRCAPSWSFGRGETCTGFDDLPGQRTNPSRHGAGRCGQRPSPLCGVLGRPVGIALHIPGRTAHAGAVPAGVYPSRWAADKACGTLPRILGDTWACALDTNRHGSGRNIRHAYRVAAASCSWAITSKRKKPEPTTCALRNHRLRLK